MLEEDLYLAPTELIPVYEKGLGKMCIPISTSLATSRCSPSPPTSSSLSSGRMTQRRPNWSAWQIELITWVIHLHGCGELPRPLVQSDHPLLADKGRDGEWTQKQAPEGFLRKSDDVYLASYSPP